MIIGIILALIIGVIAGTITGLFPGIHINLVAAGLLASISFFDFVSPLSLAAFIVAMAITHTFIDFIPSVFLGAPDEDSFLSVLPGHELLKKGRGHEAVVLTLYGGLVGLVVILFFSFIFIFFLDTIYEFVRGVISYVLIFVSLYLVFREDEFILAGVVFLLAGFLGLMSFSLPVEEPLLPLLSGLFGVSGLIVSLRNKFEVPKQKIMNISGVRLKGKSFLKTMIGVTAAAPLCSFLPGIGSGHAAVIGSEIIEQDKRGFLFLVGAINTIIMGLSFVTIYAIGKTRSGAAVAVSEILGEMSLKKLGIILGAVIISGTLAFFVGLFLAKVAARKISTINYSKVSLIVIGILVLVNLILSNWIGMIVLITGSAIGVFCILSRVRRIQLMGSLLLPTIIWYLF